jgi:hypothetical protein
MSTTMKLHWITEILAQIGYDPIERLVCLLQYEHQFGPPRWAEEREAPEPRLLDYGL